MSSSVTSYTALVSRVFVLVLLVATLAAFLGMVRDLLLAITLAAIFGGLLQPTFEASLVVVKGRRSLAAALVLTLFVLAVGLPVAWLVALVLAEALAVSETVGPYVSSALEEGVDVYAMLPAWAQELDAYQSRISSQLREWARLAGGWLVESVTRVTQSTALFIVNLVVVVYAMFFFLRDGRAWLRDAAEYLPLTPSLRRTIIDKGVAITRATVLSIVVVGTVQGLLVGLAFWVTGIPGAAFWGALVVPASAIPGLGPPLVWVPGALYLVLAGQVMPAVGLAMWGIVVRARLVGSRTKMSDLLVLIATLGGIGTMGPIGIVIGPVLAGVLLTVLDIYKETFGDVFSQTSAAAGNRGPR